jgi:AAA15 family ATPase/GTPase
MRFKNISIKGFRGIKDCSIQNLTRVNFFLGQNNSGKSSILEAIFLLCGMHAPRLVLTIDLLRSLLHNEENDFRFVFYNLDYNSPLEIKAELFDKENEYKLKILPKAVGGKAAIKTNTSGSPITSYTTSSILSEDTNSIYASNNIENINGIEFKGEIKKRLQPRIYLNSSLYLERKNNQAEMLQNFEYKNYKPEFNARLQGPSVRSDEDLTKRLETLIVDKKKSELLNSLKQVDEKIIDIVPGSQSMIYVDIGAKRMVPANLMGDGFLKFLNIITGMNETRNGIFLVDEFDNGLHYSTQKGLLKTILRGARDTNTQVFLTTHSKECLFYLKEILEEETYQSYRSDVKCFTISKLNDNVVKAYEYNFESLEYAIDNEVEIRGEI